jgi:mono/diheme cytochrome c family protein
MKLRIAFILALSWILPSLLCAQAFHNAPASSAATTNPLADDTSAAASGKKLYMQSCAQCHGGDMQGRSGAPSLDSSALEIAKPGEVFWFITHGSLSHGMPSWSQLSRQQRWQLVSFLESRLTLEAQSGPSANNDGSMFPVTCASMHGHGGRH